MKEYDLMWISLESAEVVERHRIATKNPKDALFNYVCKMMVMAHYLFNSLNFDSIRKNIQTAPTNQINREHYWVEFPNGEVLSCMEVIKKA